MGDEILLHQLLKNPVAEMLTSITYDCSRRTKLSKDSVLKNWTTTLWSLVLHATASTHLDT